MVFPGDAASAAESSRTKFSRQTEKASANFSDAKTRGAYFFSIQNHRFRLDRPISPNPLFIPAIQSPTRQFISFRRQPADSLLSYFFTEPYASRPSAHSLPAPAGQYFPPPFFSYRPYNPQSANSPPPGLAGRCLTFLLTTFLISTKRHLPDASPPSLHYHSVLPLIFLFLFFISASTSFRPSPFRTYIPPLSQRPPFLPSCCRFLLPLLQPAGQTRNVASRAGAACKAADGAGEEPAFLFSFFFFLFFSSFPSSFPSPWRRGFAATPSFFFLFFLFIFFFLFAFVLIFVLIFVFFFLLFFLLFLFVFFLSIFILIFYSCFFVLSFCFFFLFAFVLIFVFWFFIFMFALLLSLPSLFFLFAFLLSFYF